MNYCNMIMSIKKNFYSIGQSKVGLIEALCLEIRRHNKSGWLNKIMILVLSFLIAIAAAVRETKGLSEGKDLNQILIAVGV